MPVWTKDPQDLKDYTLDWTNILTTDDTIAAVDYVVSPGSELTVFSTDFDNDATIQVIDGAGAYITLSNRQITTCWLQGGVLDETYSGQALITTADGRQEKRSFQVVIGPN
ncbi:hypothetical protein BMG05_16635 [Mycobacterium malmoense]|nr:hypothetical protein BMG05_16635 [Mycobacterium malmoense]